MSQTITRWARGLVWQQVTIWIDPCKVHDPEQKLSEWKTARANGDCTTNEFRRNVLNLEDIAGGDFLRDALGNEVDNGKAYQLNGHARI